MKNKVNIIIPSITISKELITCLKGISLLNYRNFIVSIVIDYDNKILSLHNSKLVLPHPQMCKRNFVLLPLFDVDKSWKHPKSKINIVKLINSLPIKDLRSIKRL